MSTKPYKFQAFVTVSSPEEGDAAGTRPQAAAALPPGKIRRMAVRGEHHDTHSTHFFRALVANGGDNEEWIGDNHAVVSVTICADDAECAGEYLEAGDHFALWIGHDIADGIVTRRVYA
jgi:hypothetical protein